MCVCVHACVSINTGRTSHTVNLLNSRTLNLLKLNL